MTPSGIPMCIFCKRKLKDNANACEAYPNGIPDAVYFAGHLFPKPGDGGKQFIPSSIKSYDFFIKQTKKEEDASYETFKLYKDGIIDEGECTPMSKAL